MAATLSRRRRARLLRRLRRAHDSLAAWEASLRALAPESESASSASARPDDTAALLAIVAETRKGLSRLLADMGDETTAVDPKRVRATVRARPSPPVAPVADKVSLGVKACRACGRAVAAAFREAQTAADAASARILYGALRAFEKQIWLLDPRRAFRAF